MAELPAELTTKTNAEVTLVPMIIRPGDTVLIPVELGTTLAQIDRARSSLGGQFPGVTFHFVGSTMQHALIYRPENEVKHTPLRRDT